MSSGAPNAGYELHADARGSGRCFLRITAYWLIAMDDASVPPRDEDWSEYFLGFVLLGPALVGALLAIRRPIHTLRSNAVTSVGAPR